MALNDPQQKLKQRFTSQGGEWDEAWESILVLNPDYFEAYLKLREAAFGQKALSPKIQQLILIAVESACTTLFEPGIRDHVKSALKLGATKEEIFEVLEMTSVLGVHAVTSGVPALMEVLEENGTPFAAPPFDAKRQSLKDKFIAQRGYWSESWPELLSLSPDFFDAYTDFSSAPFKPDGGLLDKKTKELVYCAIDVSTTHLYKPGLKVHIRNALKYNATMEELLEVFELAALIGVHTPLVASKYLLGSS